MSSTAKKPVSSAVAVHSFPLQIFDSLYFMARGAFIDKAILSAGEMPLSIIKPQYDDTDSDSPPDTQLLFFGDKPFHAALASRWGVKITLYARGGTPSLVFMPLNNSTTWKDVPSGVYCETVTAGSDAGEVTRTLVYTPERGGYKREEPLPTK